MRKLLIPVTLAILLCGSVAAESKPAQKTFYIALSVKETMKTQDWSGRAEISKGRIVRVEKDSGPADKIHPNMSWTLVYGRSLVKNPDVQPRKKGLIITVEAPDDAVVTVKTKAGEFSFRVGEVKRKGIERLGGNVRILPAKAVARRGRKIRKRQLPPAKIAGELPSEKITDGTKQSDFPAMAISPEGRIWVAFVEWNGRDADRIVVLTKSRDGKWSTPIALDDGLWDYFPAVAALGENALVVWSAQKEGNFDLYWCIVHPDGTKSRVERLTNAPHADFQARMASGKSGDIVLVYQSLRNGNSDIYARWFVNGKWGDEIRVSPSDANDWQPDVAIDNVGVAWISWDGYETGNYDVYLRRLDGDSLSPVIRITSEPTAQFHSTVAVDRKNRVWVAWDDGGENWGKDFSRSSAAPGSRGLHYSRSIALRVYANGKLYEPEHQPAGVMTGAMTRYAELPQLATDGNGTIWLVFRHWTIFHPTEMYYVYAMKLTDDGWTLPWRLARSSGRNTQWASIARQWNGSLAVAFSSDERAPDNLPKDQIHSLIYSVFLSNLPKGDGPAEVKLSEVNLPEPGKPSPRRPRITQTIGGKTYTLLWGDCHRHTDIRGHSGVDASIMDTLRYAFDAAQLDFMGFGDHNEVLGGRWPDGLRDYSWWWTQKAIDLFTCPPTFIGLYSYEHSMSSPAGHRNIIFLKRGAPLRMIDRAAKIKPNPANMPPELWKWVREQVLTQPGQKCVIVPHTFAAGPLADWDWQNPEFDCLLEIYQGCRGSYEKWNLPEGEKRGPTQTKKPGHFAQDALDRGNIYGFVSFSDHGSTHNSWACVWVEEISREGVINAMLARRTYAASDEIFLRVGVGENHTMGEIFEANADNPPPIRIRIEAPDVIRRVDVVRNGKYIWTKNPKSKTFEAEFNDKAVECGKAYYYVRVFQRDPEAPDGDPEIAWSSPVFINFK